jgi:hypothetical protein
VIDAAGHGPAFFHRTGHGIGLEGHEDPYIVAGNALPLRSGMAFSIEPGIYYPAGTERGSRTSSSVARTVRSCSTRRRGNSPSSTADEPPVIQPTGLAGRLGYHRERSYPSDRPYDIQDPMPTIERRPTVADHGRRSSGVRRPPP